MVYTKSITKYMVSYDAYVTVELNEDLQVIGHHFDIDVTPTECFEMFDNKIEFVTLAQRPGEDEESSDYTAVTGNAKSYTQGLTLVFGQGENNDEPF